MPSSATAPRRWRWLAYLLFLAFGRGCRGRRWRRRSWPGRGRRSSPPLRRRGQRPREPCLFGQLVQVPGGVYLGGEDLVDLLWAQGLDRCVGERPGAVDDRSQGTPLGTLRGLLQRLSVADITSGDLDSAPGSPSLPCSSFAPSALEPLLLARRRWRAPWLWLGGGGEGSQFSGAAGDRIVASGSIAGVASPSWASPPFLRARRGANATPSRRASWAPAPPGLALPANAPSYASLPSVSIRAKRPGCLIGPSAGVPRSPLGLGRGLFLGAIAPLAISARRVLPLPDWRGRPGSPPGCLWPPSLPPHQSGGPPRSRSAELDLGLALRC